MVRSTLKLWSEVHNGGLCDVFFSAQTHLNRSLSVGQNTCDYVVSTEISGTHHEKQKI